MQKKSSTGKYGIVSAGHFKYDNVSYKTRSGSIMAYSSSATWRFGDNLDSMFLPFESQTDWTPTNNYIIYDGSYNARIVGKITGTGRPLLGYDMVKYGCSIYRSVGVFDSTSISRTVEDEHTGTTRVITDGFTATSNCAGGDSGGPIGREANVSNTEKKLVLVGTTCGSVFEGGTFGIKINNILNGLGLSLYIGG